MTPPRIAICTPFWGREHVSALWWKGAARLRQTWGEAGIDTRIVVGGTEPSVRKAALQYDAEFVSVYNSPLGHKCNEIVEASRKLRPDYICTLGSDDFLSDEIAREYVGLILAQYAYIGLRGMYFYSVDLRQAALFKGYALLHGQFGNPIGAGRLIHASFLDSVGWRPWTDEKQRGLDADIQENLKLPQAALIQVGPAAVAVDVKTVTNIWSFETMCAAFSEIEIVPTWPVLEQLPEGREIANLWPEAEPLYASRHALVANG